MVASNFSFNDFRGESPFLRTRFSMEPMKTDEMEVPTVVEKLGRDQVLKEMVEQAMKAIDVIGREQNFNVEAIKKRTIARIRRALVRERMKRNDVQSLVDAIINNLKKEGPKKTVDEMDVELETSFGQRGYPESKTA